MRAAIAIVGVVGLGLGACVARAHGPGRPFDPAGLAAPGWIAVPKVPVIEQEHLDDCGAAAAAMVLGYWPRPATIDSLRAEVPPRDGGLAARDVRMLLRRRGLRAFVIEGTVEDLEHELAAGRPVIVGMVEPVDARTAVAHYQVVVGIQPTQGKVAMIDPGQGWQVADVRAFEIEWKAARNTAVVAVP